MQSILSALLSLSLTYFSIITSKFISSLIHQDNSAGFFTASPCFHFHSAFSFSKTWTHEISLLQFFFFFWCSFTQHLQFSLLRFETFHGIPDLSVVSLDLRSCVFYEFVNSAFLLLFNQCSSNTCYINVLLKCPVFRSMSFQSRSRSSAGLNEPPVKHRESQSWGSGYDFNSRVSQQITETPEAETLINQ